MKNRLLLLIIGTIAAVSASAQTNCTAHDAGCCKHQSKSQNVVVMQSEGGKVKASLNAKHNKHPQLHFYLFDLEGTLVHQSMLSGKERNTVAELKKGTYLYTVFANDESIEEGKVEVK